MSTTKCPNCGNQHLQVCIEQWAEVAFDMQGSHEVTDGPDGDLSWTDKSAVFCSEHLGGCGWSGTIAECEVEGTPLSALQRHVADHYEGGEFIHVQTVEEAEAVGDTLFVYCIREAGDADDADEYDAMLHRAIDQLRSVRNELKD
jgi:hypothetical protein